MTLQEAWIKDGMIEMRPDGEPAWSPRSLKSIKGIDRVLLGTLRTEGREVFERRCKEFGVNPKQLLEREWLSSEDSTYGYPLED